MVTKLKTPCPTRTHLELQKLAEGGWHVLQIIFGLLLAFLAAGARDEGLSLQQSRSLVRQHGAIAPCCGGAR